MAKVCDVGLDGSFGAIINILIKFLETVKERGVRVERVFSSHHLTESMNGNYRGCYLNEDKRKMREVMNRFKIATVEKVSPMIIHSAVCISYVVPKDILVENSRDINQATKLSLKQDKLSLEMFCPKDDDDWNMMYWLSGQMRDDGGSRDGNRRNDFRDDTNVSGSVGGYRRFTQPTIAKSIDKLQHRADVVSVRRNSSIKTEGLECNFLKVQGPGSPIT